MFRDNIRDTDNFFFVALNSQMTSDDGLIDFQSLIKQIQEINKNRFYYYFCYNMRDYIFQVYLSSIM